MSRRWMSVWPPLAPDAYVRRPLDRLPFPLQDARYRLYARARQGIWQGATALGVGHGDEVLAPAYHHGSEIEALLRTGAQCRFYDSSEDLSPRQEQLEAMLGPRVRALLLIHYLGFPQDAPRWRRWCDERGLLLIEDAAQAWLATSGGRPVGSLGDLAVFCLYKTFGIPEGAAVDSGARDLSGARGERPGSPQRRVAGAAIAKLRSCRRSCAAPTGTGGRIPAGERLRAR